MPESFKRVVVKRVREEVADVVTLVLDLPACFKGYRAGQYLTLRVDVGGERLLRCYSLGSSPSEEEAFLTVKRKAGGKVSTYLYSCAYEGMVLEALAPAGDFVLPEFDDGGGHVTLVGGGVGVVPLFSMAKALLLGDDVTRVSLIYASRDEGSIIYRDAWEVWRARFPERLEVVHVLSVPSVAWQGYRGRLGPALLGRLLDGHLAGGGGVRYYALCGPEGLQEMVRGVLRDRGVACSHILEEHFGMVGECAVADGWQYELIVQKGSFVRKGFVGGGKTLLEGAWDMGVEVPSACLSGRCNACRARCVSGVVEMMEEEGLHEEEVRAGYVLTCVAHAKSSRVEIEVETSKK